MPAVATFSWITNISGAVGTGCLVSMALVCLVQYALHLYHAFKTGRKTREFESELCELTTNVESLQKDCKRTDLENRILREFLGTPDIAKASHMLLKEFAPSPVRDLATILVMRDGEFFVQRSRGLSPQSGREFTLSPPMVSELKSGQIVELKERELRQSVLWSQLHADDRRKITELFLVPIGQRESFGGVILASSLLPRDGDRQVQYDFVKRMMSGLERSFLQSQSRKEREDEIRFTEEMLELRALTDATYPTPWDMVRSYLGALQGMLHAAGTALYLPSHESTSDWTLSARSEPNLPDTMQATWGDHEEIVVSSYSRTQPFQNLDADALEELGINTLMRAALLVPLKQDGKVAGVFCFIRKEDTPFDAVDLKLAEWAANHLGKTLSKLQSLAVIQKQAKQDGLTDLANRRTFDNQLEREIRVALRAGVECTLLLCDLDHFKRINDSYGHQAGDEVLRVTARILNEQALKTRAGDRAVTARYGGEEMAVILPGQPAVVGKRVGEAIREAVSQETVWWQKMPINVTISIGIAAVPDHAESVQSLIEAADQALYRAKSEGRNRVMMAECRPEPALAGS